MRIALSAGLLFVLASCYQITSINTGRTFTDYEREFYVLNGLAETVSVLEPSYLRLHDDAFLTGSAPNHILYRNDLLYVTNSTDNSITIYNETTLEQTDEIYLDPGRNPWMLIEAEGTGKGYIPNFTAGTVSVIDFGSGDILDEISVGNGPEGGCYMNGYVFVANTNYDADTFTFGEGSVSIIDTADNSVIETVSMGVGSDPQSILAFPDKNEIHVILTGEYTEDDGEVVVLDGTTFAEKARLAIGGSPVGTPGSIDSDNSLVYLCGTAGIMSYNYENLAVVHGSDDYILASGGDTYMDVAVDPVSGIILVADFSQSEIIVLDNTDYSEIETIQGSDGVQKFFLVSE